MIASNIQLIGPFSQVIPMSGLPLKGPLPDDTLNIFENGGVVVQDGKILSVGSYEKLVKDFPDCSQQFIDQSAVLLPGFVDCHTHICFAGTRAQDYTLKLQGKTYIEIAREGGGIKRTVAYTRDATEDDLVQGMLNRMQRHVSEGVTTIEIKSGYGLSAEHELKMLRAIRIAAGQSPASVVATCLGAHTIPVEFEGRSQAYLEYLLQELLPVVKVESLCNRVDIFIEETAFSLEESSAYLKAASAMGFALTVHADQFTAGGALLAAVLGALSADHLEASGPEDIAALSNSRTTAVVLPGASLGLGIPFAPARKILNAGCSLAIASDWNPGSAPMGDLLVQAALLSVYEKLSFTETIAGITYRAANALGLSDRGQLFPGMLAHMAAFPANDYREILYQQGKMKPFKVWAG
jgi:imidazolonepropionase